MPSTPIALQLFTVRKLLSEDYVGTLKAAREIGYEHVQLTGALPFGAPEMREILADLGLGVVGMHVGGRELVDELDRWVDYAKAVGTQDLVWPYMPEDMRATREDWLRAAGILDDLGARCSEQGVRLSYHNHSFEFETFDGHCGLDLLYENSSREHLFVELDTYWVKHAGEDPAACIRRYAGRMPILHVKDMADDQARSFAEIGNGILDWPAIHRAAQEAGVEAYCVEQDECNRPPLESAAISLRFLRELVGD